MFEENRLEKLKNFRGASQKYINFSGFIDIFADIFDLVLYQKFKLVSEAKKADRIYFDNQTFWIDNLAGKHFQSIRIHLKDFHLTEWIPSSPGRYFTPQAHQSREYALSFLNPRDENEYIPVGKDYMVLGGIGSVRLKAKSIDSKVFYFLCASSTGISHQGIPIAMCESQYREIMPLIIEHGGCLVNLVGSIQVLSSLVSSVKYDAGIPRYCFFVEDIEIKRVSLERELLISIAIMFPSHYRTYGKQELLRKFSSNGLNTDLVKSWAFCSFRPTSPKKLKSAVNWLQDYANRYNHSSNKEDTPILSDFDETCSHFDNPIEFPIKQIFEGGFNNELLKAYQGFYNVEIKMESYQSKYDQRNSNIQFVDTAQPGSNPTFNQSNYTPEQKQNLASAAAEIQKLLNQLAQSNPTTDAVTEAVHQKIKTDPTFKARLLAALKAGGLEALKAIFNHPAFSIPAETIKGFLEAE